MNESARRWIEEWELEPHPEGGYYRRIYESNAKVSSPGLDGDTDTSRRAGSAILYVLPGDEVSRLHRLGADEMWHFYHGDPIDIHVLTEKEGHDVRTLGSSDDTAFQTLVEANTWFAAESLGHYSAVGCTVWPEFRHEFYELGDRARLLEQFPSHGTVIERFTNPSGE